jgi:hypothetical protein
LQQFEQETIELQTRIATHVNEAAQSLEEINNDLMESLERVKDLTSELLMANNEVLFLQSPAMLPMKLLRKLAPELVAVECQMEE